MIFAGKAHPKDDPGKDMIRRVVEFAAESLHDEAQDFGMIEGQRREVIVEVPLDAQSSTVGKR